MKKIYGEPQKTVFGLNIVLVLLLVITICFLVLMIYALLRSNLWLLDRKYHAWFKLEVLDIKTCSTIFVSLIGLILVRYHFQIGLMPRIVSESKTIKESTFQGAKFHGSVWHVRIRNVGLGGGTVSSYKFRVEFDEINDDGDWLTYDEVIEKLRSYGYKLGQGFFLENVSPGYTIPPKEEIVIFEIQKNLVKHIKQIDLKIEFVASLGGKYEKDVFLIPHEIEV